MSSANVVSPSDDRSGFDAVVILPGVRVEVYDAWANGWDAYWKGNGSWREATVLSRYGERSEIMTEHYGKDGGQYPDLVEVRFDCGKVSRGHFTSAVKAI